MGLLLFFAIGSDEMIIKIIFTVIEIVLVFVLIIMGTIYLINKALLDGEEEAELYKLRKQLLEEFKDSYK